MNNCNTYIIKSDVVDTQIEKAIEMIKASKRPYIYAGGGIVSCDAVDLMKDFVYKVDAPVSLSLMGQCAFDNTDERYLGMLGMHGTKTSYKRSFGGYVTWCFTRTSFKSCSCFK